MDLQLCCTPNEISAVKIKFKETGLLKTWIRHLFHLNIHAKNLKIYHHRKEREGSKIKTVEIKESFSSFHDYQ